MAKTRRLALALTDDVDLALSKLSSLTGQSKSGIISELLIDTLPIITEVIKAIEQAKLGQTQAAIETTAKFLEQVTGEYLQAKIEFDELKGKHAK